MPMVVGAAEHASIGISDSGAASICVLTRNEVRQLVKQRHIAFDHMPSRSRCLSEEDVCGRLQSLVSQTSIKDYVGEPPPIAFPTVAIAVVCVLSYVTTVYQAFTGALSLPIATALCSFIAYIAFTPMHDACHGSVAADPSFRFINNVVGTACGALFPLPFAAFKRMHLLHHKHTNDEHMDPDVWTAKGPLLLLPLRWVSIEASYYTA
jgi:fatty acid desaturase